MGRRSKTVVEEVDDDEEIDESPPKKISKAKAGAVKKTKAATKTKTAVPPKAKTTKDKAPKTTVDTKTVKVAKDKVTVSDEQPLSVTKPLQDEDDHDVALPPPKVTLNKADKQKSILFRAVAVRGHILKVIVDTLHQPLPRGYLTLRKDGIYIRQSDQANTILFDIALQRQNFASYKCKREMSISVNFKHLQKQLKSVKKKDQVSIWIDENEPEKLWFTVRSSREETGPNKLAQKAARVEVNFIVYKEEPEYSMSDLPDGGYKYPMVIDASEFVKIKRLTSVGKVIDVKMQRSNYIGFHSDAVKCFGSDINFGDLRDGSEDSEDDEEEEQETPEDDGNADIFAAQFYNAIFNLLVKLPSLCTQMQFYAPTIPHFPLKVAMTATQSGLVLGTIQVYIKDVMQINFEESLKGENAVLVAPKTKKPKKTE